jgi:hypothetical protein
MVQMTTSVLARRRRPAAAAAGSAGSGNATGGLDLEDEDGDLSAVLLCLPDVIHDRVYQRSVRAVEGVQPRGNVEFAPPCERIVALNSWITVSRNILLVLECVDTLRAGTGD